jgi:DNA-binding transcriptional LysR family regulator
MFDWNDLRYFLAVARTGSTIAAAKALDVSQSTVQRRLVILESQLGRKLVEHHPMGYRLTELGEEMLIYAETIEEAVSAFERRLAARDNGLTGTIRVTCPEALVDSVLTPLVDEFQTQYPALRVDLIVTERVLDLSKGEAEIALRAGEPRDQTLIGRKIADNRWAVYASRSYVSRHGRPERLEDINHHAIIDFGGEIANLQHAKWLRSMAPRATIAARLNTVIGLFTAAKSGIGLTILPAHLGDADDELVRVFEPVRELTSSIYLLVHPDLQRTPRVRAFFDFVIAKIGPFRPILLGEPRRQK